MVSLKPKHHKEILIGVVILVITLISSCAGPKAPKNEIVIYIYGGMAVPFKRVKAMFLQRHPNVQIEDQYDEASTLARRILERGERPDIFVSPGETELSLLGDKNLIDSTTKRVFGTYKLVVVVSAANPAKIQALEDLTELKVQHIALADPNYNSVGYYAKQALQKLGLWDKLEKKILFAADAFEALTYITRGDAQAGIHYHLCPFEEKSPEKSLKIIQEIPAYTYAPVNCTIAMFKTAKNKELATKFINFVLSPPIQAELKKSGLLTLADLQAIKKAIKAPLVKIEAYYPLYGYHLKIKEAIENLANKFPNKVELEFIDFRTDEGYEKWKQTGLSCGGIFINGKMTFELIIRGEKKEVTFIKAPDLYGGRWSLDQLEQAIRQEIDKAYKR